MMVHPLPKPHLGGCDHLLHAGLHEVQLRVLDQRRDDTCQAQESEAAQICRWSRTVISTRIAKADQRGRTRFVMSSKRGSASVLSTFKAHSWS